MKKGIISKILIVVFVIAFGVLCSFTGSITEPVGTLWSLFPPVMAVVTVLTLFVIKMATNKKPA